MNSDLETTKVDYVIKNVCEQVYNVFPFVGIKCEPSWDESAHDIGVRWYYKGIGHAYKYTITDGIIDYITDLDAMVDSLVHKICDEIIESCNKDKEKEVTNANSN